MTGTDRQNRRHRARRRFAVGASSAAAHTVSPSSWRELLDESGQLGRFLMSDVPVPASGPTPDSGRIAFDQLDTLVRVTTIQGWMYLTTLFVVFAAAVIFALTYEVPRKVNGEGILLTEKDTLTQVRAQANGRLVELHVQLGQPVTPGMEIGHIAQNDLEDVIRAAEANLADLKRDDRDLTQFEEKERKRKEDAVAKVRHAVLATQTNALDKLKIAQRVINSADRLRDQKHLGDLELLESHQKFYEIKDELFKGDSRLAELDLELATAENVRRRLQLERKLKIGLVETKLALDREKLDRTSRIVCRSRGDVTQILSTRGELVHEGAPVVLLHAPKEELGTDDSELTYHAIVFVPAGEGKKIKASDPVEVSPATIKREEHGFIRGKVVAVSELPATKLAMEAALAHPELVDTFLKRYAPGVLLRVHVKLDESAHHPGAVNPFRWSSSSGSRQPVKTGTMCQAAVVVQKPKLISLILPWTKMLVGAD
jgi:HlyD family secretion protein